MAIHYITSTASTGTGTFYQLNADAADGDTIQPDPTIFPPGTVCKTTLASNITGSRKNVNILGAQTRIEINGDNRYCVQIGSTATGYATFSQTIEDVDFVNLCSSSTSGSSGPIVFYYVGTTTVRRCRAVGCTGYYAGGFKVYGSSAKGKFYDCAAYGNRCMAGSGQVAFAFWFNTANSANEMYRCTYGGCVTLTSGTAGAFKNTPSKNGDYVSPTYEDEWRTPPPSTYAYSTWTEDSWQEMDPRPTSTSSFRTGSSTSSSDILDLDGRTRRANGAKGAFEYFDEVLATPTNLAGYCYDSDGFQVRWSPVANATQYRVTIVSLEDPQQTETSTVYDCNAVFGGLEPFTTYLASVVAQSDQSGVYYGDSDPATIELTTLSEKLTRLSWPTYRESWNIAGEYIGVEWRPEECSFIRVTIYRGAQLEENVVYREVFEAYGGVNEVRWTPPASGTYTWGLKGYPAATDTTHRPSLENTATMEWQAPSFITLDTPTNLAASNITDTSATLSWGAVTNASGYKVEWRASGTSSWNEQTVN